MTLYERLDKYTSPEPNSGCWLWTANINHAGYGTVGFKGKVMASAAAATRAEETTLGLIGKVKVPGLARSPWWIKPCPWRILERMRNPWRHIFMCVMRENYVVGYVNYAEHIGGTYVV